MQLPGCFRRHVSGITLGALLLAFSSVGWSGELPKGDAWLQHVTRDLLPFWAVPDAQGSPKGDFPTFRCNDGRLPAAAQPCPEIKDPPAWIRPEVGRTYVRMQGRQTYAYAVAFHLTGDRRWLELAQAGAEHTLRLLDPKAGAPTWFEGGRPQPTPAARNAQDQSYAVVGLAMLYYLTRDPRLERALVAHERFVFERYWDKDWDMLRWVAPGGPAEEASRQELVAQLDQLNAYMILVTPYLPEADRKVWRADIRRVVDALRQKFHDPATGIFFGTLDQAGSRKPGGRHNDFGHTIKTYWMLLLAGRELDDPALQAFAREGAARILPWAWHAPSASWASEWRTEGVNPHKTWWIYAELDQMAVTLAQEDRAQARYLETSWPFWLEKFVDRKGGEVWGWVRADGWVPPEGLKIHHWKSGFHSFEHALVSYLGAQALAGQPATLHFATGNPKADFRPYTLLGKVASVSAGKGVEAVRFTLTAPAP